MIFKRKNSCLVKLTTSLSVRATANCECYFCKEPICHLQFNGDFPDEPGLAGPASVFFSICSRREPLRINGIGFLQASCPSLSSNQHCQRTEGNSKHKTATSGLDSSFLYPLPIPWNFDGFISRNLGIANVRDSRLRGNRNLRIISCMHVRTVKYYSERCYFFLKLMLE